MVPDVRMEWVRILCLISVNVLGDSVKIASMKPNMRDSRSGDDFEIKG